MLACACSRSTFGLSSGNVEFAGGPSFCTPQALSAESKAKRLETNAAKRELLREDVLLLWERGVVPVAIADALNISDERVAR